MSRREYVFEESMEVLKGGESQAVSVSTTSAQSSAITTDRVVAYATVECWFRQGSNPTAVSTGVDQYLPAGVLVRLCKITPGNKLAFKSSGTGTVYLTPGA